MVPEQFQAPTQVERPSELLRGKKKSRATAQDSQASLRACEGKMPLGKPHGRPPDLPNSYTQRSPAMEQSPIDLKALVRTHKNWRPVLDDRASAHIDPLPGPTTIQTGPNTYFEVSALLEGEQNIILPIPDSEQAVIPKTFSFSPLPLVLSPLDTLKRDLKPGGVAPKQHRAAHRPTCLKPPDHITEDLEKAGGAQQKSAPAILPWPQLAIPVRTPNVQAPDPCTVEAKCKAKWPPQVQATEHKHRFERLLQEAPYEPDLDDLNDTGTCKPEVRLAVPPS